MDLALDRNPKLKVQYSQAQTLRDELKHQRRMLNRPLLSSSGTVTFFFVLILIRDQFKIQPITNRQSQHVVQCEVQSSISYK
jgi:hypothetical protein